MAIIVGSGIINGTPLFDLLVGGDGNDTVNSGNGSDLVFGRGGNDRFNLGADNCAIDGGDGSDRVVLAEGAWSLSLPNVINQTILFNLDTGQKVSLRNVESVQLGDRTINFRVGNDFANVIAGSAADDFIKGGGGNDRINGKVGNDWISSGPGSDTVTAGDGNDVVDDRLNTAGQSQPPRARNSFDLGNGNDTVLLAFNYDQDLAAPVETFTITGGAGTDIIHLSQFFLNFTQLKNGDIFLGGTEARNRFVDMTGIEQVVDASNDKFFTFKDGQFVNGRAQLSAKAQNPAITGSVMSEDFNGNARDNVMTGNGGYDRFFGKGGVDTAVLAGRPDDISAFGFVSYLFVEDGVTGFFLRDFNALESPKTFIGEDVERVRFANGPGGGDDITYLFKAVAGDSAAGSQSAQNDFSVYDGGLKTSTRLNMLGGDDLVIGRGEIRSLAGGDGNDILDWDVGGTAVVLTGGAGNDEISTFRIDPGEVTQTTIDGGGGNDTLSSGGSLLDAHIFAGNGDDVVSVGTVATVDGGAGNDRLNMTSFLSFGFGSNQVVDGGTGDDVAVFEDSILNIVITRQTGGVIELHSASNQSTALFSNVEGFVFSDVILRPSDINNAKIDNGTILNNLIAGTAKMDFLRGAGGDDRISGKLGNDALSGELGDDTIAGEGGNDLIGGGDGNDVLKGGAGNDFFDPGNNDRDDDVTGNDNDHMSGGAGDDEYFFNHFFRDFGTDTISDFATGAGSGDVLLFRRGDTDYDTAGELLAAAKQVGDNTVITLTRLSDELPPVHSKIILVDVDRAELLVEDFGFV